MNGDKLFQNINIKDLFRTENIIGKNLNYKKYADIMKDPVLQKIFCNQSMNETVNSFFDGGLNLSKASSKSYVHRNTLIYRINKIKNVLGLDLRVFEDCIIFMNAREIYRLLNYCGDCKDCVKCK